MPQQRETTTNNLADIIQLIQIAHRSGTLTVERGEGQAFEEGAIVFINGQITEAQAGNYTGPTALGWLTTWTTCRFAFIVANTSSQPSNPSSFSGLTGPQLSLGYSNTRNQPSSNTNPTLPRISRPLSNGSSPTVLQKPYRVPTDGNVLAYMEQVGLTREHRRLYMLIDGQRTTHELIALMGKDPEKILELLSELEQSGLVMHN